MPEFPLPKMDRFRKETDSDGRTILVYDASATKQMRKRELQVWAGEWSTPQACAWSTEPWRWQQVAEFCRLKTVVEAVPDANASLVAQLHRYRDQIGLTPAGLKENGWAIAPADAPATSTDPADDEDDGEEAPRRLSAVPGA